MYVVTKAGREVWESENPKVPQQYRLLLWLLDVQGEKRAVHELRQDHPERLLRDWLKELQELGFVESLPDNPNDTTPLILKNPSSTAGGEAASALNRTGAYVSVDAARSGRRSKPPANLTVLIVEDDPDQLSLADLRLSTAGYGVRTASSVGELMHALRKDGAPDLLLMDVILPDGNGFDVLAKIRRHPKFAALPIIMLTGERDPADIGKGLAWGADGYVTKPYSRDLLADVISRVLG
jgi:two-component system OmpR family response regulator